MPGRAWMAVVLLAGLLAPFPVMAAGDPDPVNAVLLSAGSTALPVAVGTAILNGGRGADEGVRLTSGLALIGGGAAVGPSIGQLYGRGGVNAWVTMGLRLVTSATMSTGIGFQQRGNEDQQGLGDALFWVGLVPTALLGIYDIATAYRTADQARYRNRTISGVTLPQDLYDVAVCGPIPCATSR